MKEYKVNWANSYDVRKIKAGSPAEAGILFIKSEPYEADTSVEVRFGVSGIDVFKVSKLLAEEKLNEGIASPSLANETQDEILKQLKQINWAVRIGFVYIMGVISGIIPTGVFG